MRTFIAIELEEKIKEFLSKIQAELKKLDEDIKWVTPHNAHLTLKFLGEVEEQKIPKIIQLLKEIACAAKPFTIEIKDIGSFPNLKSPRVIWVGVEKGKEELTRLAHTVEDALVSLKFPKESRAFSTHFTLGRVKHIKDTQGFQKEVEQIQFPLLAQEVTSVTLFKSTLTPKGPIYEKLTETNLSGR
ncbi:MAG: 2'-5' RNA ligase [Omnitrophica WOR_2 bacterium GWF2_43_52]|nr:MAG: 2'-5' RNA ligase [Omnitrophica WOR_2 bacterium GWC2_44_8]OGX20954.1 MAG: 2'-5' RNA ligase [Omnitrophica WOR_2 bacterium GWF2_43_52]OGX58749.1 MAG: 2'-5' RNA ligase [Omnitrophica WOR_2 bacterium RIFOXYC2_FULL_43_9]HAH21133.1 RNA 2',3'-cyclic phosphodiesterase [Candidatus Omnitrophota bacterium]HBG63265.1 RNA 2',3'-cyclic phosphodiesterase [Candidatus Omnitrophota bacterium]